MVSMPISILYLPLILGSINISQCFLFDSVLLLLVWFVVFCWGFFACITVAFLLSVIYQDTVFYVFCNMGDTVLSMCSPVFLFNISLKRTIIFLNQHFNNCWEWFGVFFVGLLRLFFFWLLVCFYLFLKPQISVSHLLDFLHHMDKI